MNRCVAIDLDYTLIYNADGGAGLFDVFKKYGVLDEDVIAAYESCKKDKGVSMANMCAHLSKSIQNVNRPNTIFDFENLHKKYKEWCEAQIRRYPDVKKFINSCVKSGIKIAIVTAGDREHQFVRAQSARLPLDHFFAVPRANEKSAILKQLLGEFGGPVIFIDDKFSELDAVRDAGLTEEEVRTFRILRANSPYIGQIPKYGHGEVKNLHEIVFE